MLKIKVDITEEYAITAISWYLNDVGIITDVQVFKGAIRAYLYAYGSTRLQFDARIHGEMRGAARELVNKYYNK